MTSAREDRARSPKDLFLSLSLSLLPVAQRLTRRFPCAGFIVEFAETSVEEHGGTGDSHVADPFLALIVAWSTPIPRSASTHSLQRVSPLTWPRHCRRCRTATERKPAGISFLTDSPVISLFYPPAIGLGSSLWFQRTRPGLIGSLLLRVACRAIEPPRNRGKFAGFQKSFQTGNALRFPRGFGSFGGKYSESVD